MVVAVVVVVAAVIVIIVSSVVAVVVVGGGIVVVIVEVEVVVLVVVVIVAVIIVVVAIYHLENNALEVRQKGLQRHDNSPQIGFILRSIKEILSIKQVVHRAHVVVLAHNAGANTSQLLHVTAYKPDKIY